MGYYESPQQIAERWAPYLEAAGIPTQDKKPLDIYLLAGKLIHDPVVRQRASDKFPDSPVIPWGTRRLVIAEMTHLERRALRQRVTGIYQPPSHLTE